MNFNLLDARRKSSHSLLIINRSIFKIVKKNTSSGLQFFLITGLMCLFFIFVPVKETMAKKSLNFSGYTWQVKQSTQRAVGPGPNYWSGSSRNLWVDDSGNLHLRIDEHRGRWYSSEIWLDEALGYGTYKFTVKLPREFFDRNVVLGLFNYLDDSKEFDIEISKWAGRYDGNAGFAVQPADSKDNIYRFSLDLNKGTKKILSFTWLKENLTFSCENFSGEGCIPTKPENRWEYGGNSLPEGELKTHINLWLVDGNPPTNGEETEVIIEDFTFNPVDS